MRKSKIFFNEKMGKCTCCGNNFEGNYSFCSTKCGLKFIGKMDQRKSNKLKLINIFFQKL